MTASNPSRTRLFKLIAATLPLLLLALVEIGFRLAGYGGYEPTFRKIGATDQGTLFITDREGPASYFPKLSDRISPNSQFALWMPKPTNTVRIMMLGESALKGFPQSVAFASSAFLHEMCSDLFPGKRVEVINLGCTAVASFPIMEIAKEALQFDPDLMLFYYGHNEFYGTYGVASSPFASSPRLLALQRRMRGLGIIQFLELKLRKDEELQKKRLMEVMARGPIAPDDPKREAAVRTLRTHTEAMLVACREKGVPAIVCLPPSNEKGLSPVGRNEEALKAFHAGHDLLREGNNAAAVAAFTLARDLDAMPWRATTKSIEAIREAATGGGAIVCDVRDTFRSECPDLCIGWDLMDDHVHPTLKGQVLMARAMVEAMTKLTGPVRVAPEAVAALPAWDVYARRLEDNIYDRYAVALQMKEIFQIPFLLESNPEATKRFEGVMTDLRNQMPDSALPGVRQWELSGNLSIGRKPIAGYVASLLMTAGRHKEALALLAVARRSVPRFTSWHISSTYYWIACRQSLAGTLTDDDLAIARDAINEGLVLLKLGRTDTGQTDRFVGRLYQLCGDFAAAIPHLKAAVPKLYEMDRVATDQALMVSYLKLGDTNSARAVAQFGAQNGGGYAVIYKKLLADIDEGRVD